MANFKKLRTITLTDETASTGVTYVWTARVWCWITLTQAKAMPIWQIVKYVKTGTTTITTDQLYPFDTTALYSEDRLFVWNNRASLTYDA